jgi:hypothetical protein
MRGVPPVGCADQSCRVENERSATAAEPVESSVKPEKLARGQAVVKAEVLRYRPRHAFSKVRAVRSSASAETPNR